MANPIVTIIPPLGQPQTTPGLSAASSAAATVRPTGHPVPFSPASDSDVTDIVAALSAAQTAPAPVMAPAVGPALATVPVPVPVPVPVVPAIPAQETSIKPESPPDPKTMVWNAIHASGKKVQEERARMKEEMAALQKAKAEIARGASVGQALDPSELRAKPIAALAKLGMNMNDIIKAALAEHQASGGQVGPQGVPQGVPAQPAGSAAPTSEVAGLKQELAEMRDYLKNMQFQATRSNMVNEFRGQLQKPENSLLSVIPEAHEVMLANAARYAELSGGEVLTPDKVAATMLSEVQENIVSLFSNEAVKKFLADRGLLAGQAAPAPAASVQGIPSFANRPATLTNQVSGGVVPPAAPAETGDLFADAAALIPKDFWTRRG